MFTITNIDNKTILNTDSEAEFVNFVRRIAVENDDAELSITCKGEALDYLDNYSPNLHLINNG